MNKSQSITKQQIQPNFQGVCFCFVQQYQSWGGQRVQLSCKTLAACAVERQDASSGLSQIAVLVVGMTSASVTHDFELDDGETSLNWTVEETSLSRMMEGPALSRMTAHAVLPQRSFSVASEAKWVLCQSSLMCLPVVVVVVLERLRASTLCCRRH
jgi:hypothetical protein